MIIIDTFIIFALAKQERDVAQLVARHVRDVEAAGSSPVISTKKKVSEKDAFFFCYAARLLSIFIFKTSLVFSIISFGKVILQK